MAKKSKKQRAQLRKRAQTATAERLDVAPTSGSVPSVSPPELVRHSSGMRLRVESSRPPAAENRTSPRVSLAVDIHLASHSHFFSGLSGDISEGGVFLSTYRSLPIGSAVDLEFSLPGSDRSLHVRGTVRWVREHSPFGPRGVGIAFEELSPDARNLIHEFCSVRPALYYDDLD